MVTVRSLFTGNKGSFFPGLTRPAPGRLNIFTFCSLNLAEMFFRSPDSEICRNLGITIVFCDAPPPANGSAAGARADQSQARVMGGGRAAARPGLNCGNEAGVTAAAASAASSSGGLANLRLGCDLFW